MVFFISHQMISKLTSLFPQVMSHQGVDIRFLFESFFSTKIRHRVIQDIQLYLKGNSGFALELFHCL
jgi:hypothetical protein